MIHNFSDGDIIDYTFHLNFPHTIPHRELVEDCMVPAINAFHNKYKQYLPKRPTFSISTMDRLGLYFSICIHFPERNMDVFYNSLPDLLSES